MFRRRLQQRGLVCRPSLTRVGFSLIEVLIALMLTLALAALLLPDFTSFGVRATRQSAADALQAAAFAGRSKAMTRLEPFRFVARRTPGGIVLEAQSADIVRSAEIDRNENAPPTIFRLGELPAGLTIETKASPGTFGSATSASDPEEDSAPLAGEISSAPVTIAMIMPDGTFEPVACVVFHRGQRASLAIERWTGRLTFGNWGDVGETESEMTKGPTPGVDGPRSPETGDSDGREDPSRGDR